MKRCVVCGEIVEDDVDVCPVCKAKKFEPIAEDGGKPRFACEHVIGDGKVDDEEIMEGLRAHYPEVAEAFKRYAYEEAEHAAKFAELLGEVVTPSTKKNLELRAAAEAGACEGKLAIAKRAKQLGYDAIHDTVHEMAKDEARHGAGFAGLLKRYFGK